jgi:membrane-bound serine protease (ClpP class)
MFEQLTQTVQSIGPDIFYGLLMLGLWGVITAIYVPGTGLPEGTAAIGLVLASVGLLLLPATVVGLILLGASLLAFLALIFFSQRWWLIVIAFALSVAGGLLLFGPGNRVSPWSVALVTVLGIAYHQLMLVPGLRIQKRHHVVGGEALIGEEAQVITALEPIGTVRLHGEIWRATAVERIEPGEWVVITDLHNLQLTVSRPPSGSESPR